MSKRDYLIRKAARENGISENELRRELRKKAYSGKESPWFDEEEEMQEEGDPWFEEEEIKVEEERRPRKRLRERREPWKGVSGPLLGPVSSRNRRSSIEEGYANYFFNDIAPSLRKDIRRALPEGAILRGRGRKNRENDALEFIVDYKRANFRLLVGSGYIRGEDGEWFVYVDSPYVQGHHESHGQFLGDANADEKAILDDVVGVLEDMFMFYDEK